MRFVKDGLDISKIDDPVFAISRMASADDSPKTVNATIGSLFDEDGKIVAFKSFYDNFDKIDDRLKAKYADSPEGNKEYKEAVEKHLLEGRIKIPHDIIATAGGSGAVSLCLKDFLKEGESVLAPDVAWASYKTMAKEYGLDYQTYDVNEIEDMLSKMQEIATRQDHILVIINSPCHNPTGISYSKEEWRMIIDTASSLDKKVIILDDVAYIDYSYDLTKAHSHFDLFDEIADNVLVAIAFSISKTMTAYGLRLGALITIHKDEEVIKETHNALVRSCRNIWSNTNNAAMIAFSKTIADEAFYKEKAEAIKLLHERAMIFLKEANEVDLKLYRYDEGFFITVKMDDDKMRDEVFKGLIEEHIYTVKVYHGIRIAICSIPKAKLQGLASKIKKVIDNRQNYNQ